MRSKRVALALAAVALVAGSATACDDGPRCLRSHTEWHFVSVYNGKTYTQVWTPFTVCDRYAEESPSGSDAP